MGEDRYWHTVDTSMMPPPSSFFLPPSSFLFPPSSFLHPPLRYLATFEEEVTKWQKNLGVVADSLLVLNEIQRTWSYLEPLFIKSEEVRKELPKDAKRFQVQRKRR